MQIDELKDDADIANEAYPYEYAKFTALKIRESGLETELEHASSEEKKILEGQVENVREKLRKLAAA